MLFETSCNYIRRHTNSTSRAGFKLGFALFFKNVGFLPCLRVAMQGCSHCFSRVWFERFGLMLTRWCRSTKLLCCTAGPIVR